MCVKILLTVKYVHFTVHALIVYNFLLLRYLTKKMFRPKIFQSHGTVPLSNLKATVPRDPKSAACKCKKTGQSKNINECYYSINTEIILTVMQMEPRQKLKINWDLQKIQKIKFRFHI